MDAGYERHVEARMRGGLVGGSQSYNASASALQLDPSPHLAYSIVLVICFFSMRLYCCSRWIMHVWATSAVKRREYQVSSPSAPVVVAAASGNSRLMGGPADPANVVLLY